MTTSTTIIRDRYPIDANTHKLHLPFFKGRSKSDKQCRPSLSERTSSRSQFSQSSGCHGSHRSPINGVEELPDTDIEAHFADLHSSIIGHVQKYYSPSFSQAEIFQSAIEHATTGMPTSWLTVLSLLTSKTTCLSTLALCIGWTILSRSLLLKLGLSSNVASTFLPPEIVECFQSFSGALSRAMIANDGSGEVHFGLLSRWKQSCAALMHTTYVRHSFSHFDSRTVNIDRALNDLDPLLRTYASSTTVTSTASNHSLDVDDARLADLREVLRDGARFAFLLFSQPSFWQFDWTAKEGASEEDIVIWPCLIRVMDSEGQRIDGSELGKKMYLHEYCRK